MARLCSCNAKISLPGKRDHILVIDRSIYEHHGKAWCAELIRGKAPVDPRPVGRDCTQPTFVNFTLLGEAK